MSDNNTSEKDAKCCGDPSRCRQLCDKRMAYLEMQVQTYAAEPERCAMNTEPQYVDKPRRCSFKGAGLINGMWFCKTHGKLVRNNPHVFNAATTSDVEPNGANKAQDVAAP